MQDATEQAMRSKSASLAERQRLDAIQATADLANAPKPAPMGSVTSLELGGLTASASRATHGGESVTIRGSVLSVAPDEGVVLVSAKRNVYLIGDRSGGGIIAVRDVPDIDKITDGDLVDIVGGEDGTYAYTTALGASAHVRAVRFRHGHFKDSSGRNLNQAHILADDCANRP